jgi:hypothetical protein
MRFAARRKHENRSVFNHEAAPTDASAHNDLEHGIPLWFRYTDVHTRACTHKSKNPIYISASYAEFPLSYFARKGFDFKRLPH